MARTRRNTASGDKVVDELMQRFYFAYDANRAHFERMERISKAFGNNIDSLQMPTISNIPFPVTYSSIADNLPFAIRYLFPRMRRLQLIPSVPMDAESVEKVEEDLYYTMMAEMSIFLPVLTGVKDCLKYNVGYGLVDTTSITPPEVVENQLILAGAIDRSVRSMQLGRPKKVPSYEYLSPVQVVPMPDGSRPDGPGKASGHFVIVMKTEDEFRSMYDEKDEDGKPLMSGDPDAIIEEARSRSFDHRMPSVEIIAQIAGIDLAKTNNGHKEMPVVVPIVRAYFDHEHAWIANGSTMIYHAKDKYQTMLSDLVMFSAAPDGNEWFALGDTEASEGMAQGLNIWNNGMIDLSMALMNPTRILNTRLLENPADASRGPGADIRVTGNPDQAMSYANLPPFPQQLFQMGDVLKQMHGSANGQLQSVVNGQVGLVRGGGNALEMMLQTTTGRQYLAAMVMQTGGMQALAERVLIKKQLLVDETGHKFIKVDQDEATGRKRYVSVTVTPRELRNVFRVEFNMPEARMNGATAFAERVQRFDRAMQREEFFDVRRMYQYLWDDDDEAMRVMLPRKVVEDRQARRAEALLQQAGAERGGAVTGRPGPTQAEQGAAGAAGPVAAEANAAAAF